VEQVMRLRGEIAGCAPASAWEARLGAGWVRNRGPSQQSLVIRGTYDLADRKCFSQLPGATQDTRGFDASYSHSVGPDDGCRPFFLCGNVVRAALTPGSSEITLLDRPGDSNFRLGGMGDSLGSLVAWPELESFSPNSRIRAWKPDGAGVRTLLAEIPVDV